MSIVFSGAYILARANDAESGLPRIYHHNLVAFDTITADQETTANPATNLANPDTSLLWKSGSTATQKLTVLFDYTDPIDYVAFARHNFADGGASITSIEILDPGGDPDTPGDWTEVVGENVLADNLATVFQFTATVANGLRITINPGTVEPQAAVMYCGTSLPLPEGIPPGHMPIKEARQSIGFGATSNSGDRLGYVELGATLSANIVQKDVDPAWYRANLREIARLGKRTTFFFAWDPENYPDEVGFCWPTNDPKPTINRVTGHIDITFEIGGLAV